MPTVHTRRAPVTRDEFEIGDVRHDVSEVIGLYLRAGFAWREWDKIELWRDNGRRAIVWSFIRRGICVSLLDDDDDHMVEGSTVVEGDEREEGEEDGESWEGCTRGVANAAES